MTASSRKLLGTRNRAQAFQRPAQPALHRGKRHSGNLRNLLQPHPLLETQTHHHTVYGRQLVNGRCQNRAPLGIQQRLERVRTAGHEPRRTSVAGFVGRIQATAVLPP